MRFAIVGGGLTGCVAALEAADRGHAVVIFERAAGLMTRASLANEGKVHLGYVYGADASFRTAARMIEDALWFRPILERWIGQSAFEACLFAPFTYLVPRDSQLPLDRIAAHLARVDAHLDARRHALGLPYLGQSAAPPSRRIADDPQSGCARFETPESGVWPAGIAAAIRDCVAWHPRITVLTGWPVERIAAGAAGRWSVLGAHPGMVAEPGFDRVINAAWAGRRTIDRRSGFGDDGTWFTRYKFGCVLDNAAQLLQGCLPVNSTATSGRFGDSVYYPQDDTLYCSWYPVGLRYAESGDAPDGPPPHPEDADGTARAVWAGYARIDPDYARLSGLSDPLPARLIGDYIIAKGASDIDDPDSLLHERRDFGPEALAEGYWTVETGKYTSAPRCALTCIDAALGTATGV